jgi:RNA 3'-terminal phosphate cyclase (ATP)
MTLTIDGSAGEGGGQILRTALALSLVTGTPFEIEKIRARRARPGLLRQHLAAVKAAAEIGGAKVEGAALGSRALAFWPGPVRPGEYRFAIGSAGSACLVAQTVLPALLLASGPSTLIVEGGTYNPSAPPWDYLARVFLPILARMGARARTTLERAGFVPAGGGRMRVEVEPVAALAPLVLLERGAILRRHAKALVSRLPRTIAERELRVVRENLPGFEDALEVVEVTDASGPGNVLLVELECEHVSEIFSGFGRRGVRAETVAEGAVREARQYLDAGVPVGPHLADQLLLPIALAGEGRFRSVPLSAHSETNLEVVQRFLPIRANVEPEESGCVTVKIAKAG